MSNLVAASNQWARRPADERFWNLEEMYESAKAYHDAAAEATVDTRSLSVSSDGDTLRLQGSEKQAALTHHCFGQLCVKAGVPADYVRGLPAGLAAANVNHGLATRDNSRINMLMRTGDDLTVRCMTSDQYSRIWNFQIIGLLRRLSEAGEWRVPPARPAFFGQPGQRPATAADVLPNQGDFGLQIRVGDMIAPAGLYASDHDMFAFMVNENRRISDGTDSGMARGFFVSNSEVGAAAFKVTRFCYRHVCGNHIVWGASNVEELRIVHRGSASNRFGYEMIGELRKYADEPSSVEEGRVLAAKQFVIAGDAKSLVETLFKASIAPKKVIEAAYELAKVESDEHADIDPRSAWGMAQGFTALARREAFADNRAAIEKSSGKILSMAF